MPTMLFAFAATAAGLTTARAQDASDALPLPMDWGAIAAPDSPYAFAPLDSLHLSLSGVALYGMMPATQSTKVGSFAVTGVKARLGLDWFGFELGYTQTAIKTLKLREDLSAALRKEIPSGDVVNIVAFNHTPIMVRNEIAGDLNTLAGLQGQGSVASNALANRLAGPLGETAGNLQATLNLDAARLNAGASATQAGAATAGTAGTPLWLTLNKAAQLEAKFDGIATPTTQNAGWLLQAANGGGFETLGAAIYDPQQAANLKTMVLEASKLAGLVGRLTGDVSKLIGVLTADGKDLAALQRGAINAFGHNWAQAGQTATAGAGYLNSLQLRGLPQDLKPLLSLIPPDVLKSRNANQITAALISGLQNALAGGTNGIAVQAALKLLGVNNLDPAGLRQLAQIVQTGKLTIDLSNYQNAIVNQFSHPDIRAYGNINAMPFGFYLASPEFHAFGLTAPQGLLDFEISAGPAWGNFGVRGALPGVTGYTVANFYHYGVAAIPQIGWTAFDQHVAYAGAQGSVQGNLHVFKLAEIVAGPLPALSNVDLSLTLGVQGDRLQKVGKTSIIGAETDQLPKRLMFGGGTIGVTLAWTFN